MSMEMNDHNRLDEKRARIESSFLSLRPVLPPMVIVCNEDEKGCVWTREKPDPVSCLICILFRDSIFLN